MPSINVEGEVSELAADPETVEILEQCVINWLNQISAAVEGQLKKTPQVTCALPSKIPVTAHDCRPEKEPRVWGSVWPSLSSYCFVTSLKDQSKHTQDIILMLVCYQTAPQIDKDNTVYWSGCLGCQEQETQPSWLEQEREFVGSHNWKVQRQGWFQVWFDQESGCVSLGSILLSVGAFCSGWFPSW